MNNRGSLNRILLLGASQRMLVPAAIVAGVEPVSMDLFADWDTRQWEFDFRPIQCIRLDSYDEIAKHNLAAMGQAAILGGGVELRSGIVESIEAQIPVLGCSSETLRPFSRISQLLKRVSQLGFDTPATQVDPPESDQSEWLVKRESACGGSHVRPLEVWARDAKRNQEERVYFQRRIVGPTYSALFASSNQQTVMLGVSQQLNGDGWLQASTYGYSGSLGPIHDILNSPISCAAKQGSLRSVLGSFGCTLADDLGLRGIWGVDFLLERDAGRMNVIDINPRIPASAELFAVSCPLIQCQMDAVFGNDLSKYEVGTEASEWIEGKAILFHRGGQELQVDESVFRELTAQYRSAFFTEPVEGWTYADVPDLKTVIKPNHPVLTLRTRLRRDDSEEASVDRMLSVLKTRAREVEERLAKQSIDAVPQVRTE